MRVLRAISDVWEGRRFFGVVSFVVVGPAPR